MKIWMILFAAWLIPVLGRAADEACMKRLKELLKTESELYLLERKPEVLDYFDIKCTTDEFGESIVNGGALVFIHEASHFEDFGMKGINPNPGKVNFFTINNEHLGDFKNIERLPPVKKLINLYLQKKHPDFLLEDSVFMGTHDEYLGAEDGDGAAENLQRMAWELNGYTHGSVLQSRLQELIPSKIKTLDDEGQEVEFEHPLKNIITQGNGVFYFIYNLNLYLRLIKEDHPTIWEEFNNEHNRTLLKKLLSSSIEAFKSIGHCSLRNSNPNFEFYIEELKKEDTSILKEILGPRPINDLICEETDT